jgi:serine protease inhibitor
LASPSVIDTNKTDPVSILEEISNTKFVGEYVHIDNKNDQFDWELTKEIFRTNINKNTIISPLSVKILMTLIAEAAGKSVYSLTRKVRKTKNLIRSILGL